MKLLNLTSFDFGLRGRFSFIGIQQLKLNILYSSLCEGIRSHQSSLDSSRIERNEFIFEFDSFSLYFQDPFELNSNRFNSFQFHFNLISILFQLKEKTVVNGNSNGVVDPPMLPAAGIMQPVILGPNAPRTFLILQPQTNQSPARLSFPPQGQRLLLAIQRPGGGVQHVAMPTNVVSIPSNQLQTNGGVVAFTSTGGVTTVISTPIAASNGVTSFFYLKMHLENMILFIELKLC